MSIVHLKTRKQRIALNKKATEVKQILWRVGGHEVEVLEKPENEINCFETTEHKGVFFDGKEVIGPGRMGSRVGFIMNDIHYQVISWGYRFTGVKESKGGKFLLIVDGWEVESRTPVNKFFRTLYSKVLFQGVALMVLSMVGVAAIVFAHNRIISSWVARVFLVLLPLGFYYLYVGLVGVAKFQSRMFLDETGQPWWPEVDPDAPPPASPPMVDEDTTALPLDSVLDVPPSPSSPVYEDGGGAAGPARPSMALLDEPELLIN